MWVGTQNGLDRFDPHTGKFVDYYERDGLAGDTVSCVLEDAQKNLWISTNKGLSRFDSARKLFRNYTVADGLPGNDLTGWTACAKNRSGEMFFGGFSGATAFNPEAVGESQDTPPIVLTEFRVSGYPCGSVEIRR
jgi:ligand-binding sensor domain-containing protein